MTFLTRLPKQISLRSVYSLSSGEMELEYSWHIRFESACSATCIGVTHQGSRCIFWYRFRNICTLPQLIRTLCLQLGVFSPMAMTNLTEDDTRYTSSQDAKWTWMTISSDMMGRSKDSKDMGLD